MVVEGNRVKHGLVNPWAKLLLVVNVVTIAAAIAVTLQTWTQGRSPYMVFVPGIIVAAIYAGTWPAVLVTALSSAVSVLFLTHTSGRFDITSPRDAISLSIYLLTSVIVTWVCRGFRHAQIEAEAEREKIRQARERFRVMADNAPVLVRISDADQSAVWFNKPWLDYTGRTMPQELGDGWNAAIHPDDITHCRAVYAEHFHQRAPFEMEYRLRRCDGQYRWFFDRGVPLYEGVGGAFSGYIRCCTDITARHEADEQRTVLLDSERAARMEAERVGRMKDEFLATLSHELRTPLSAILGWSHILRGSEENRQQFNQGMEAIERNARVQTQMIEELLDMSRIISGKIRLDVQRVDLVETIEAAAESVLPGAKAKNVRIIKVLDPLAGPVSGDPGRLQQVIWNLLSNSIKFTPSGGRVEVVLKRVASHVEISVTDTGRGISADFLPHVFERFRQSDATTTRQHSGLGLGLSIVKQMVELHGGSVRVESAGEGQGTTFTVALPMSATKATPDDGERRHPTAATLQPVRSDAPRMDGIHVLVVDDDRDTRDLIQRIFLNSGATVETAPSAADALAMIQNSPPKLLVSDIGMPGQDGYELIRRVRSLPASKGGQIPAIALTAFARSEDRQRALIAGYQMHVAKPVEPSELVIVGTSLVKRAGAATPV